MLAYIFWHRPYPQIEQKSYEAAIGRFQRDLAGHPPPGFISAASFQIEPVPWLDGHPGYEDWCVLDGSWALDPLNGFAVTGPRQPSHDAVAAQMEQGQGGLYAHAGGEAFEGSQSTVYWLTRPRGISWGRPRTASYKIPQAQYLAPADGAGAGRGVCRRGPR